MSLMIHILLPVHNRCEITRRFVECLRSQSYQKYNLILIDDGSTDGTAEMVREIIDDVTVIQGNGNLWWAGALQQGYKWLNDNYIPMSDLVLIINDDTEFEKDFLENAMAVMNGSSRKLLLARSYDLVTKELYEAGVHVDWRHLTFERILSNDRINCFSTRGLFLSMEDMRIIGGFYPKILPHYLSDYEFTIRAVRKGMFLTTDKSVRLFFNQETTGFHACELKSFKAYYENYFSIKSSANIISWTSFILLAAPVKFIPLNIIRIWLWFFLKLIRLPFSHQ